MTTIPARQRDQEAQERARLDSEIVSFVEAMGPHQKGLSMPVVLRAKEAFGVSEGRVRKVWREREVGE